ncbi:hypothetical protein KP509_21G069300 [Ceratopteris richardii]|uniref:Histone deacetylase domain-containing protein n=1 Tax=Ceratopteris richardii TaxID=49495 RepID=A0A8T2SCX0_CERRI|nr:hypothetical protein KP509_21G069300 [Ceratopteris richardii]KAH7315880.1 hypothetical protein KP509_21G069300 [Ceratopteris richardii]
MRTRSLLFSKVMEFVVRAAPASAGPSHLMSPLRTWTRRRQLTVLGTNYPSMLHHYSCTMASRKDKNLTDTKKAALQVGGGRSLVAFYADNNVVPLPSGHRFPMEKYRATRLMLEEDASMEHILITRPAPFVSVQEILLVHEERYLHSILNGSLDKKEQNNIGFPWSPELVNRTRASMGGTVAAMHSVMLGLRRAAANIAGGTHHAFSDHGEGFCIFNDIAIAARVALEDYSEKCNLDQPILVIDLDVHQGNGTAKIFEGDDRVITFSIQGANNYPWRTRMKSDYDVDLPDETGDDAYLAVLSEWLQKLFTLHKPSLIFFQAGVDALREDSFGRLSMSRQGLLQRNNMVYSACLTRSLPLVITMGGGYSRPSDASVVAHADVYRSAALRYSAMS